MQALLNDTWRVKFTRDRGKEKVPTGARVLNVLRVENHPNYQAYFHHKAQVRKRQAEQGGITPFHVATETPVLQDLDKDVNEMYLFHGTNPSAADAIAKSDFDLRRVGSAVGTMFGPGIYVAENASKSDEYAKEGEGIFIGQCALLLCRAVAGKVFTSSAEGDHSRQVKSGQYDSVCGDRLAAVGTFREMIFYDKSAVYCEFIILYSRDFGDQPAASERPPVPAPAAREVDVDGGKVFQSHCAGRGDPELRATRHILFSKPVYAQQVRVMPCKWEGFLCCNVGLLVAPETGSPPELVNPGEEARKYSSTFKTDVYPGHGRSMIGAPGTWAAHAPGSGEDHSRRHWMTVHLPAPAEVHGVAMTSRVDWRGHEGEQRVTAFRVSTKREV